MKKHPTLGGEALTAAESNLPAPRRYLHIAHEEAVAVIAQERGAHSAPDVVDAFLAIQDEFRRIASRYRDEARPS